MKRDWNWRQVFLLLLPLPARAAIEIDDPAGLDAVRKNLAGEYILTNDIDLSEYAADKGWMPIGTYLAPFTGVFDGGGHTIMNLTINRDNNDDDTGGFDIGLFGVIGEGVIIKNVKIVNADVTGHNHVGGLVGTQGGGVVENCSVAGSVKGDKAVGGLVGGLYVDDEIANAGGGNISSSIEKSCATSDVTGGDIVGGLVGGLFVDGNVNADFPVSFRIENSYATGNVIGVNAGLTTGRAVGGLVGGKNIVGGDVSVSITKSYATGNVDGNSILGGLVGAAHGNITYSYATGNVTGAVSTSIGGLVGSHDAGGAITSSYAVGNVYSDSPSDVDDALAPRKRIS